jgi:DNA-binding protein HU-beta
VNKAELIAAVGDKSEMTKKDAEKAVNAVFEVIGETLSKKEKIQITGFGTFDVRQRAARKGRNPLTNEEIMIPASKAPVFKAGKSLKETVQ